MYVCHCQVVNDRRIREEIEAGAITPRQVAERCGAGATCAGCLPAIRQLLMEQGARPCECPCPLAAAVVRAKLAAAATAAPAVTAGPSPAAEPLPAAGAPLAAETPAAVRVAAAATALPPAAGALARPA